MGVYPRAVQGRLRLWCADCSACSDSPSDGQRHPDWALHFKDIPVVLMLEATWTLVSRLQSDLLRAACGQAPEWVWVSGTSSDSLLTVVRHLAFLLVGFPWSDGASPHWHPGCEHAARMIGALAVVAAVLDGAAPIRSRGPEREPVLLATEGESGYAFGELYGRLSWADAGLLRRALPGCGPQRLLRVLEKRVREVNLRRGPAEEQTRLALARRKRDRSAWRPVRLSGTGPAVTLRGDWA